MHAETRAVMHETECAVPAQTRKWPGKTKNIMPTGEYSLVIKRKKKKKIKPIWPRNKPNVETNT